MQHCALIEEILNMSYINKRAVRKLALDMANSKFPMDDMPDEHVDSTGKVWNYAGAKKHRIARRYKQVSTKFLDYIDLMVRNNVQQHIEKMDNKGSTVK